MRLAGLLLSVALVASGCLTFGNAPSPAPETPSGAPADVDPRPPGRGEGTNRGTPWGAFRDEEGNVTLYPTSAPSRIRVGDDASFTFRARNGGENATWVAPGCDTLGAWSAIVRNASGAFVTRLGPMMSCAMVRPTYDTPFPRGAIEAYTFHWDGRTYDPRAGGSWGVTPGLYVVEATFTYSRDDVTHRVTAAAPVLVEESDATSRDAGFRLVGHFEVEAKYPRDLVWAIFLVENEGAAAALPRGCEGAWQVDVYDAKGRRLETEGTSLGCYPSNTTALEPGDTRRAAFQWRGNYWTGEHFRYAGPGDYTLKVSFRAEREGAPAEVTLVLPFHLREEPKA